MQSRFPDGSASAPDAAAPIILTALMDKTAFAHFDAMRGTHFPPERNFIPAHITLFHHLPGPRAAALIDEVKDAARHEAPIAARTIRVHMMGRGVAYIVEAPALNRFRARLEEGWSNDLVPQDRQGFRPHITVQNKVNPEAAKTLHSSLSAAFRPFAFQILGVTLWWYRGGPWEHLRDVRFRP